MRPVTTAIPVDIEHARSVAVTAVNAAGALLREGTTRDLGTRAKGANGDVVTDLDFAAERLIVGHIRRGFPSHRIIAEESDLRRRRQLLGLARGPAGWHQQRGHRPDAYSRSR